MHSVRATRLGSLRESIYSETDNCVNPRDPKWALRQLAIARQMKRHARHVAKYRKPKEKGSEGLFGLPATMF